MFQPAQQIRFCTSRDGTRIAYATCGTGPPLLWAASWFHHLELDWVSPIWRPWISLLSQRHTLVRYDWRGCGLSDRDQVEFSFDKFVEDLEAVIGAARLEQFVLFGIAAGAAAGMAYAVRYPKRISRLVLYASYARNRLAGNPTPQDVEESQARLKVIELGWPNDTRAYGQFFTALHLPDASTEQSQSFSNLVRQTTSLANNDAMRRTFSRIDVQDIVPKVRCPTLVLHSRGNSVIPFESGRSLAGLIPGARFVPLDSNNHVLLDTEPAWQQLVEALDDFLPAPAGTGDPLLDALTAREREVLELVAQGLDNGTIGEQLHISERTARNHVSAILAKLGINTRAQAIVRARDAGFGREKAR
ncbi:MAG TPA: alpha/beta fold hydrolase [Burkholderiales bacterium]|nr:alpha/beta fold hydrolase [Burkholderiales bacterium]